MNSQANVIGMQDSTTPTWVNSFGQAEGPAQSEQFEPFVDEHVVARFLQLAPRRILEMARTGEIPAHPIGRTRKTWRFRLSEIDAHFSAPMRLSKLSNFSSTIGFFLAGADLRHPRSEPLEIEAWFEALTSPSGEKKAPFKWTSIAKIKSIMSQVFRHAQRHELIPAAIGKDGRPTNPVLLARSESGSGYEAAVVSAEQMIVILNELNNPETRLELMLALLHAATALRPEEAFGLKWMDIDWRKGQINIRRGWSKGKETAGKNEGSMTQVVMHPALAQALQEWRRESRYASDSDWVFASSRSKGKKPRSAGVAGQDYLRPAAVKAGVIPAGYKGRFGWHNLRHSLATFFAANEVNLPVIQSVLRHSKPSTTAVYTHRVNAAQLAAQAKYLEAIKVKGAAV